MEKKVVRTRLGLYGERFFLVLFTTMVAAVAFVEWAFALHLEFAQSRDPKMAMEVGAWLWLMFAAYTWFTMFNKNPKYSKRKFTALLSTTITAVSIFGIYTSTFVDFVLWAGAVIWILFLTVVVLTFPESWRECGIRK